MRRPEDCTTMTELRAEIDMLDRQLVELLVDRARYIDRATEIKQAAGMPARIEQRVEQVVANARAHAADKGLDPELIEALWRPLINWSIAREEKTLG